MGRRASGLVASVLLFACGVSAAASPPHKRLDATVGKCRVLGGSVAFYVCPPFSGALPVGDGEVSAHVHWRLLGRAVSSNGRRAYDDSHGVAQVELRNGWPFGHDSGVLVTGEIVPRSIVFAAFAPAQAPLRGYAVWRLPQGASTVRVVTAHDGRTVSLRADGRLVPPTLAIRPATVVHSAFLSRRFGADLEQLAAIADGHVAGACSFYNPRLHESGDASCARELGLTGLGSAIRASAGRERFRSYNGWTLAFATVGSKELALVLDGGHFRFLNGYQLF